MFPDITVPNIVTEDDTNTIDHGKEPLFDFKTGQYVIKDGNPVLVDKMEALKIWIDFTIKTARYRFPAYSFDYGCEIEHFIGLDIPQHVIDTEVKRVVKEALIYDDRIIDITNFTFSREKDKLEISITLKTVFDEFMQEVRL